MAYNKTNWQNLPSTTTPVVASNLNKIEDQLEALTNMIYPVGSIYMSVNNINPSTLFGGTWEQIKDKFLLSAGDTYTAGSIGGNATTTLQETNLPSITKNTTMNNPTSKTDGYIMTGGYTVHGTIDLGGSATPFSNMPPYLTVYVWERIA